MKLRIAVLGDGAGLARLGLEQAGHDCTGFELDPSKHYLSQMVGSGNCILADMRDVDLSQFDAVWASPPCQHHSDQNHGAPKDTEYSDPDLLDWCLNLDVPILWVENVLGSANDWPRRWMWNAAQFLREPVQKRRRVVAGRYKTPYVYRDFKYNYPRMDVCPAVLASEYKQGGMAREWSKERRKATRWYGRPLSVREMAYHQGFELPEGLIRSWWYPPPFDNPETGKPYTTVQWRQNLSQAIGNGVPVYMAKAFGAVYTGDVAGVKQLNLPIAI